MIMAGSRIWKVSLIVGVSRWHSVDGQDSTHLTHCSVIGTLLNPPALSPVENGLPLLAKEVEIHILRYEWCCHTLFNCRLCDRSVLRCLTSPNHWIWHRNRAPGGFDQQKHRHLSVVAPTAEWRSQRNCSFATTADKQWCWWRRDTGDKAGRTTRPTAISIAKDH